MDYPTRNAIDAGLLASMIGMFTEDDIDYWLQELEFLHGKDDKHLERFKELLTIMDMTDKDFGY